MLTTEDGKKIAINRKDGHRVTFRLTAEQESRLKSIDRKTRRALVPALRKATDRILKQLAPDQL